MFHVCLDFGIIYGVGVCVNVCGVVCYCMLFVYVCEGYVILDQCDEPPPPCFCSLSVRMVV